MLLFENLEKHKAKCPNKVVINSELEKEMQDFIKNKKNISISNIVEKEDKNAKGGQKENISNNHSEIEGLNSIKYKKKKKKSKKEENKE